MNSTNYSKSNGRARIHSLPVRLMACLIILLQLMLPANAAVAVVQDQYVDKILTKEPSRPDHSKSLEVQLAMAKTVPSPKITTTILKPSFSDRPTDQEFFSASIFAEPLIPMAGVTSVEENKALAEALLKFENRTEPDDVSAILAFLEARPTSAWRVALLTDLGLFYREKGYFTRALDAWSEAWEAGKGVTDSRAMPLVDRAVGELAELNARLGRKERVLQLLDEVKDRHLCGPATEEIMGAKEGLWGMDHKPEQSFLCGPLAVGRVFRTLYPAKEMPGCLMSAASTSEGTSLWGIYELANKAGLNARIARRSPGAEIVVPAVIHWKAGHFAALVEERNGQYFVRDATFGKNIWMTKEAIEDESSGYFLLPNCDHLSSGWSDVDPATAKLIRGKGKANNGDASETRPNSKKCAGDCPPLGGMAGYTVNTLLVSLNIVDTPVAYYPPYGFPLVFKVSYNQRDSGQSSSFNYPNLGPKWTFSWMAFVTETTPNSAVDSAQYNTPGGGYETYDNQDMQGVYPIQRASRSRLQRLKDGSGNTTGYQMTFADGSAALFTYSDGAGSARKWFMTQLADPFGNGLTNNYVLVSSKIQLATVSCATATATLSYNDTDPYKITGVSITTSGGGTRSAQLAYSDGELVQITDAVGLKSQFSYDSSTTDFINALTTPYGRTTFSYLPYPGYSAPPDNFDRWLVITDPLGQQKRLVYQAENDNLAKSESLTPAGMTIYTDPPGGTNGMYLQYRNTLYWDKKAMQSMADPNNPDLSKAHIYHWLHLDDHSSTNGTLIASGVLESEKSPLEGRIWYAYPGQTDNRFLPDDVTTISSPSKIARVLDDGTTQTYQYTYNDLGQVTSFTDPIGRTTTNIYDANLIDLLEVHQLQTSPTTGDMLLTKMTYNIGHEPLKVQDASGQTTSFTYNSHGQLTQVIDPKAAATTMTYNPTSGFLQTIVRPAVSSATVGQRTTTLTPDSFFRAKTVTDGDGYVVTNSYDDLDRLISTAFPDGTTNQIVYQNLSPVLTKDRLGRWSSIEYDALGRAAVVRDAQQRTTRFDYCSCGDLASITDPNGNITTWVRDLEGRVTTKIFPDNSHVDYVYEGSTSRLKSMTDAMGQTTTYLYFSDNNLSSVAHSGGAVPTPSVSFTYDPTFNRIATMQDGTGVTTYKYKSILSLSSPPTSSELTAALGAGRLQSVDGALPNDTFTYAYDELGRVISRSIQGVAETTSYDALSRVIGVNNALDNFSYTYDSASSRLKTVSRTAGQILALTYFPGTDPQNQQRLQTILNETPTGTAISQFDYDYTVDGQVKDWTRQTDGNSGTATFYGMGYDSANQMLSAVLKNGTPGSPGSVANEFGYTYDGAGNRLTEYSGSPFSTNTLQYNNLNELTNCMPGERVNFIGSASDASTPITVNVGGSPAVMSVNNFNGYGIASSNASVVAIVARDNAGNRATNRYWVTNLVVSGTNQNFSYDLNGNLVAAASGSTTNSYEWDEANRLTAVEKVTSGVRMSRSEFTYDGLGRRVKIVEKDGTGAVTSTKRFVWCGTELCQERDETGSTVTKQFFSQGEVRSGTKYYYTRDHLGSVREVTDGSGDVLARYDYDPYGARTKINGSFDCDFGFTAHYFHAPSGLYFTMFRAYNSGTGKWLSRDLIGENGGLNLYGYTDNNPINDVDLLGLADCAALKAAFSHISGLARDTIRSMNELNAHLFHEENKMIYANGLADGAQIAVAFYFTTTELAENAVQKGYKGIAKVGGKIWKKQMKKHAKMIEEGSKDIIGDAIATDVMPPLIAKLNKGVDTVLNSGYAAAEGEQELGNEASIATTEVLEGLQEQMRGLKDQMDDDCCDQ